MTPRPSLLLIDNWDSFTHILAHGLEEAGAHVTVVKNNDPSLMQADRERWNGLVISPGPGTPEETGHSRTVIEAFTSHVPVLGVCLGHQLLASLRGAKIIRGEPVQVGLAESRTKGRDCSPRSTARLLPPVTILSAWILMGSPPHFGRRHGPRTSLTSYWRWTTPTSVGMGCSSIRSHS